MYLARVAKGAATVVIPVDEWVHMPDERGIIRRRQREPWSRKTKTGAAALSQSREGAIASATIMLNAAEYEHQLRNQKCKLRKPMECIE